MTLPPLTLFFIALHYVSHHYHFILALCAWSIHVLYIISCGQSFASPLNPSFAISPMSFSPYPFSPYPFHHRLSHPIPLTLTRHTPSPSPFPFPATLWHSQAPSGTRPSLCQHRPAASPRPDQLGMTRS